MSMVKTLVGLEESEIESEFAQVPDNYGSSVFSTLFSEVEKMQVILKIIVQCSYNNTCSLLHIWCKKFSFAFKCSNLFTL